MKYTVYLSPDFVTISNYDEYVLSHPDTDIHQIIQFIYSGLSDREVDIVRSVLRSVLPSDSIKHFRVVSDSMFSDFIANHVDYLVLY